MIIVPNMLKMGRTASATNDAGGHFEFGVNPGDVIEVGFRVNSLSGSPTTATFGAKWQFAPKILATLDEDALSSTVPTLKWFDVAKSDANWADYFVDEDGNPVSDWPSPIADAAAVAAATHGVFVSRKIKVPGNFLVRCPIVTSFSGGSSPAFTYTQEMTQYSKLA